LAHHAASAFGESFHGESSRRYSLGIIGDQGSTTDEFGTAGEPNETDNR
jgi:hypothetical protein